MNKFIQTIQNLDMLLLEKLFQAEPKWIEWAENSGKNALHYPCGISILQHPEKADASLEMLKALLKKGMDINSIDHIGDGCDNFPATPLWYA
jgi:hypothetical protein